MFQVVQRGGDLGTFHGKTDKCAVFLIVFGTMDRRQDHTMQRFADPLSVHSQCVLLCFIEPIVGNRGPGDSEPGDTWISLNQHLNYVAGCATGTKSVHDQF